MWICQQCGADVQEDWDTCWNCSHVREQGLTEALVTHSEPRSISNGNRSGQCSVCQSTRIIPNLDVRNTGATHSIGQEVEVARHPNAAIFRGAERSSLRAWVCACVAIPKCMSMILNVFGTHTQSNFSFVEPKNNPTNKDTTLRRNEALALQQPIARALDHV